MRIEMQIDRKYGINIPSTFVDSLCLMNRYEYFITLRLDLCIKYTN